MFARSKSSASGRCTIRSLTRRPADLQMSDSTRPREPGVPAFSARRWISALAGMSGTAIAVSISLVAPAMAEEVRIGIGFGLAFLPTYICEDAKLVEKYGKEAHLDLKV